MLQDSSLLAVHTDHVAHTLQRAPPFDAADESIGGMSDPDPDPDPAPIFE